MTIYVCYICLSALWNIRQKPYFVMPNTQSIISTPIFHPNSTPSKIINTESKCQNTPSKKQKIPDMKHR